MPTLEEPANHGSRMKMHRSVVAPRTPSCRLGLSCRRRPLRNQCTLCLGCGGEVRCSEPPCWARDDVDGDAKGSESGSEELMLVHLLMYRVLPLWHILHFQTRAGSGWGPARRARTHARTHSLACSLTHSLFSTRTAHPHASTAQPRHNPRRNPRLPAGEAHSLAAAPSHRGSAQLGSGRRSP